MSSMLISGVLFRNVVASPTTTPLPDAPTTAPDDPTVPASPPPVRRDIPKRVNPPCPSEPLPDKKRKLRPKGPCGP